MSSLDFITLWRAQPFRPFRVHTHDNQAFDVELAQQVGISPGLRLILIAIADNRFEVLTPERIARCEVLTDGAAPIPAPPPVAVADVKLSPGGISFLTFTATDGRRMVQFVASDAEGNPILSSAGTRWDIHGMETFENGRSLYIHHIDDLTITKRIIIWPPDRATFDSFAEALSCAEIQKQLHSDSSAAKSTGFSRPKDYSKSIKPDAPYIPPMPKFPNKDGLLATDPNRFAIEAHRYEAAPGIQAIAPTLTDIFTDRVMFDLMESGWGATIIDAPAAWELTLRFAGGPARDLKLSIDAFKGLARVSDHTLPLETAERHLRNFPLHNSWESLLGLLTSEPRDLKAPEVTFRHQSGVCLEFWPGKTDIPPPFLTPRIVDSTGRTILDCRGSVWGAIARVHDAHISLNLLHHEVKTRFDFTPRLDIDAFSHRVTSGDIPGSTCLATLHPAIQACRTPEWMLEELQELFARGKDIPIP